MDGVKVPDASGAVVVCGKCNVPLELHPHEWCPFEYRATEIQGRTVGYSMLRKK
jgi:hypothetical protein